MAFSFARNKTPSASNSIGLHKEHPTSPKLPNYHLERSTKGIPSWLKDNVSNIKNLPGVYQGVLGQVQPQTNFLIESMKSDAIKLVNNSKKSNPSEYMSCFTDTERVRQLLSLSRLPNETLATIWAHVNKSYPGRLTNREVCLALGLIALFQKLERDGKQYHQVAGTTSDPFNLIKTVKKPPVPSLYPSQTDHASVSKQLTSSNSVPSELNSANCLLVDFNDDKESKGFMTGQNSSLLQKAHSNSGLSSRTNAQNHNNNTLVNLIDSENDQSDVIFNQTQVWLRVMTSMRSIFKRSFDILNVENSRQSALEALGANQGVEFCKNLSLCYPVVHNIKFKVDELVRKNLLTKDIVGNGYVSHMNDLMISINEYWAVLINLFHESGQTNFIELIMDGLNRTYETVESGRLEELMNELDSANKSDICAICQTKFYLINIGDAIDKRELADEDLALALNQEVFSCDGRYYYHSRCANFWLNNVDPRSGELPFKAQHVEDDILKPTSL